MSFCLWKELTWERALLRPHYYCYYCSDKICLAKSDSPSANKLDGVCGWVTFSLETAPIFKTILEMSMSREPQHSWSNVQYSSLKISQFAHSLELPVPSLSYIYIHIHEIWSGGPFRGSPGSDAAKISKFLSATSHSLVTGKFHSEAFFL